VIPCENENEEAAERSDGEYSTLRHQESRHVQGMAVPNEGISTRGREHSAGRSVFYAVAAVVLSVLKRDTRSRNEDAWAPNSSLDEAISSLPAAACSVTWAMP
jgi:hypothetical protein